MSKLTASSTRTFHTGNPVPVIGFGVGGSGPEVCEKSTTFAIDHGYKMIDSAAMYKNEKYVGRAASSNVIPRRELFLTTKAMLNDPDDVPEDLKDLMHRALPYQAGDKPEKFMDALRASVREMDPGPEQPYVDLMLIHHPTARPEGRSVFWAALTQLQAEGYAKDIGVSNFSIKHLDALPGPKPACNQIELHPWCRQRELVKYCEDNGILLQAFAPMVRNKKAEDPTLKRIAEETGKTVNQVLIRWSIQMGYIPLPKSDTPSRIASNIQVFDFELSSQQMRELDMLGDEDAPICRVSTYLP